MHQSNTSVCIERCTEDKAFTCMGIEVYIPNFGGYIYMGMKGGSSTLSID